VVTVAVDGGDVKVEVCDDGRGMPEMPQRRGLGLLGIEERARELGGTFVVDRPREGGTRVRVQLPCPRVEEVATRARVAG
jgi:signal transduction histidine kinase